MLRYVCSVGTRLIRSQIPVRGMSVEATLDVSDVEREKKMKLFELELDLLSQEGHKVPEVDKLRPSDWDHILSLPSKSARRRHYMFLWKNHIKKANEMIRKEEKKNQTKERLSIKRELDLQNDHIVYGLNHNSMFMRVYDTAITKFQNSRLVNAMMYGQKIVYDCSYDEYMNRQEASNTGKQLMLSFAENRMNNQPFDIHFCNVNKQSHCYEIFKKFIPTMEDEEFPMNIHQESFTEIFDKKRLVYLTPHCKNELKTFNHDDIYIIGAIVDKQNNEPISLAKAKKQGLRMAKLPLDSYLHWSAGGGKSLTLNQMISIMLEMKNNGDWNEALKIVPRRKIHEIDDLPPQAQPTRQPYYQKSNSFGFDRQRQFKEKQHFEKFKFDLQTWGSKVRKQKDS